MSVRLTYRKWHKAITFLLACFVVPELDKPISRLGPSEMRIGADNRIAAGVDHIFYGWGFFVAILLILMLVGSRYADRIPNKENAEPLTVGYFRPGALLLTFASALIAVCSGPGFHIGKLAEPRLSKPICFLRPSHCLAGKEVRYLAVGPRISSGRTRGWRFLCVRMVQLRSRSTCL